MREVAERAGVAMSSVSRVLANHPDVSPAMRRKVIAAVEELGYEPDFLAQSLRRGATLSVGFVVGDIGNPLMATIASGAERALRAAGYSMLVMNSENEPELDSAHIRFFVNRRVDGLLLSLASERRRATLELLSSIRRPIVVLDRSLPARLGASAVLSDHRIGIRKAVEHLVRLGHRRIALITGQLDLRPSRERVAALQAALEEFGLAGCGVVVTGSYTAEFGEQATTSLLDRADPPTAIVAGGNQLLIGCLRAIRRGGLRVGEAVSVVTCDDVPLGELFDPPIASVSRDTEALGRAGAELLLARLSGSNDPTTVVLPTEFVVRPSVGPAAHR